ncbi:hypothetical protein BLA17378_03749 [Burkholderia aenigmatica]|uniref:Uncharacterized protein n=1 Tax=Burkholderia aenigmatica TaxID=2015348 RepID=A0ABY6XTD2_9BURK|nr:hypothetical protein BLA17378_03749 [Burkholderia aenigmatica]
MRAFLFSPPPPVIGLTLAGKSVACSVSGSRQQKINMAFDTNINMVFNSIQRSADRCATAPGGSLSKN